MRTTRRNFISAAGLSGVAGFLTAGSANSRNTPEHCCPAPHESADVLRICFLTDAHLPNPDDGGRLANDKLHHQERVRVAFDRANDFKPDAFVFGGDNVFAVDQSCDGGHLEANARAQFNNWKALIEEKVKVPHHSVIGNHDIWMSPPAGMDRKILAIEGYEMPNRHYSWKMKGWKFLMLDVYGITGKPLDKEQWDWLVRELEEKIPTCIVTHAPIFSIAGQLCGGTLGNSREWRELFYKRPHVTLALSGHNHLADVCKLDEVTYICGGAVSGGWWEGAYFHFPPVFTNLELFPDGTSSHAFIEYDGPSARFKQMM